MSDIDSIVSVSITANTRTPTRAGFGTPLLMAYHTRYADSALVRSYTSLTGMVADGFALTDPAYLMAQAVFSQSPRPPSVKVGRLPAAHTHTQTITITSAVEGEHVKLSVRAPATGVVTAIDYTILAAATTTSVATAVELLIEAIAGVDSSSAAAVITVTPTTPGNVIYIYDLQNCTLKDTTAAAAYDTALSALQLVDDDWYFVCLDVNSEANVDAVAAWTETRTKLFVFQTQNDEELAGTGTMLSQLEALAYTRSIAMWVESILEYGACAWVGKIAPKDPGSITWKFKSLAGVTPSILTETQKTNLGAVLCNYYTEIAGLGVTIEGYTLAGATQFADVIHGIDWLTAQIQERVFAILANADKIPYTDASADMIRSEILSALEEGVRRSFLEAGTLTTSAPLVSAVSTVDRAARLLPDVEFGARLAGAVHSVEIVGTLSV